MTLLFQSGVAGALLVMAHPYRSAKQIMKTLTLILAIIEFACLRAAAIDAQTFTFRQFAVTHAEPVSFSIAYPKGWRVIRSDELARGQFITSDSDTLLCRFFSDSNDVPKSISSILVERYSSASPQEAAEQFEASIRSGRVNFAKKELKAVVTKSSLPGYVMLSERDFGSRDSRRRLRSYDYFFSIGGKRGIHITCLTEVEDAALAEDLHQMILQSLKF